MNNENSTRGINSAVSHVLDTWTFQDKQNNVKSIIAIDDVFFEKKGLSVMFFDKDITCDDMDNFLFNMAKTPVAKVFFPQLDNNLYQNPSSIWMTDKSLSGGKKYFQASSSSYQGNLKKENNIVNGLVNIKDNKMFLSGSFSAKICELTTD